MCLDDQIAQVKAGMQFISKYREEGIASAEVTARELAEELEVDRSYPEPRRRKKTRLFSYEAVDESDHQTGEEVFRRDFFYPLMDTAYASLQERCGSVQIHLWISLWCEVHERSTRFQKRWKHTGEGDIDASSTGYSSIVREKLLKA